MSRSVRAESGPLRVAGQRLRTARRIRSGWRGRRPGGDLSPGTARGGWRSHAAIGAVGSVLLALMTVADTYAQQRIGRLFSTPEQRMELDRIRNDPGLGDAADPAAGRTVPESLAEPVPEPDSGPPAVAVTFNGVVLRSDGHRLAWVNGVEIAAERAAAAGDGIEPGHTPDRRLRIRLSGERKNAVLKPGQTMNVDGRVLDAFERRTSIRTMRPLDGGARDSRAREAEEDAGDRGVSPEVVTIPSFPVNLVRELLRGTYAAPAPPDTAAPDARLAGDGLQKSGMAVR